MKTMTLKEWLDSHYITYSIRKDILVIPGFGRFLIQENYDHIFKQNKEGEKSGKEQKIGQNNRS